MFETCNHRNCAVVKLLTMIKIASENVNGMSEDDILTVGTRSLVNLGVSEDEIATAAIVIILSPLMGDIDDDPAMSTRNGEHPEG